ncbi:LAQU0S02e01090g1_1 [Lachancea quebecensis]|uniref:LAQU0S02e01090g1_1 n=1 Tax=Lachancea quebecensis TaxID=1654605 RepID=A0A0P1KXS6_9SACH|nr:LAQU0S02e01090g1_1 [Lachancea quebecensis]
MVHVESLSLEETNKLRVSLGLKPIDANPDGKKDVPRQQNEKEKRGESNEKTAAEAVSNGYERDTFVDNKVSKLRWNLKRAKSKVSSSTALFDDDGAANEQNWLASISTRKKPKRTLNKVYDELEEASQDAEVGIKVSQRMSDLSSRENVILTLQEADVHADDREDVLIDEGATQDLQQAKRLELKRMNQDRKRKGTGANFAKETEEHQNQQATSLRLVDGRIVEEETLSLGHEAESSQDNRVKVSIEPSASEDEERHTTDFAPIKIKKRKKLKGSSLSQKRSRPVSQIPKVTLLNEDTEDPVEEELKGFLKIRKSMSSKSNSNEKSAEQIAFETREEALERKERAAKVANVRVSQELVLDENSAFLDNLKKDLISNKESSQKFEKLNLKVSEFNAPPSVPNSKAAGESNIFEEKNEPQFYGGLASTLSFLKDHNILPQQPKTPTASLRSTDCELLALKQKLETRKVKEKFREELSQDSIQYSREELDRIEELQNREIAKRNQLLQKERLAGYNPEVKLTYKDDRGNELTTKEAYKQLSQAFHGTHSNRKKLAKAQRKVEQRNQESQHEGYM